MLRNIVIESQDRSCEVEWCVQGVGKVVAEAEIFVFGWDTNPITLGQIGRIKLFLLVAVSLFLFVYLLVL